MTKSLGELLPSAETRASKVSFDTPIAALAQSSDRASAASLFFAVKGAKADGHAFAPDVARKGAVVVVERRDVFDAIESAVLVDSTRLALGLAAARWYGEPTRELSLVGVTGTNGKTTTTYLLKELWEADELLPGVVGTVELHLGKKREPAVLTTPDALSLQALFRRMREEQVTHAAIEVTSIALDQYRVAGCHFDIAVFTNLTQDHLDYHGDFASYYAAKRRLFFDYDLSWAVINTDDTYGARLFAERPARERLSFSLENESASIYAGDLRFAKEGTRARLRTPQGELELFSPLIGRHNLYNCLGTLGAIHAQGLDLARAVKALARAQGAPGRLERVDTGPAGPHVFVDYAHTDDALNNVLRSLVALRGESGGRIITVFGCGGDRDAGKRPLMAVAASAYSDVTVATSDNPRTESPDKIIDDIERGIDRGRTEYHREVKRRDAIRLALSLARSGDLVLVAGKGHETYQIVGTERLPFDDREVVREYYGAKS